MKVVDVEGCCSFSTGSSRYVSYNGGMEAIIAIYTENSRICIMEAVESIQQ